MQNPRLVNQVFKIMGETTKCAMAARFMSMILSKYSFSLMLGNAASSLARTGKKKLLPLCIMLSLFEHPHAKMLSAPPLRAREKQNSVQASHALWARSARCQTCLMSGLTISCHAARNFCCGSRVTWSYSNFHGSWSAKSYC